IRRCPTCSRTRRYVCAHGRSASGRRPVRIATRIGLVVLSLAIAAALLTWVFHDFDVNEVIVALRRLSAADYARICIAFVALLIAEAVLAAAFVPGLSLGRGALTFLATSAVTSVVPGP